LSFSPNPFSFSRNPFSFSPNPFSVGGSNAGVYACYVDGWQCAMKELSIQNLQLEKSSINNFESEIGASIVFQIPVIFLLLPFS
tara:strand:- start:1221 stop:1472 length:252 start_codon:yes stop_codon:yes gene_type:complete